MSDYAATLKVGVSADTSHLESGLDRGQAALREFATFGERLLGRLDNQFEKLGASFQGALDSTVNNITIFGGRLIGIAGVTLSLEAIHQTLKKTTEEYTKLSALSDKTGVGTEFLQAVEHSGHKFGVTLDSVNKGVESFSKNMAGLRSGTGDWGDQIDKVSPGLSAQLKATADNEQAIRKLSDAMKSAESPAERVRLAAAAMGDSNLSMARAIGQGSDALAEMERAGKATGLILDSEVIARGRDADRIFRTMSNTVYQEFSRALVYGASKMADFFDWYGMMSEGDLTAKLKAKQAEIAALESGQDASSWGPGSMTAYLNNLEKELGEAFASLKSKVKENFGSLFGPGMGETMKQSLHEAFVWLKQGLANEAAEFWDYFKQVMTADWNGKQAVESVAQSVIDTGKDIFYSRPEDESQELAALKKQFQDEFTEGERSAARAKRLEAARAEAAKIQSELSGITFERESKKAEYGYSKGADAATAAGAGGGGGGGDAAERRWAEYHRKMLETSGQFYAAIDEQRAADLKRLEDDYGKKLISEETYQQARLDIEEEASVKRRDRMMKDFAPVTSAISNDLGSAFDSWITKGEFSWKKLMTQMLADIAKAEIRMQVLNPIFGGGETKAGESLLGKGLGALFGTGSSVDVGKSMSSWDSVAASSGTFDFKMPTFEFHSGGLVGEGGESRWVPPHLFDGAARFHDGGWPGLAASEVPAILQKGELVLPRDTVASLTRAQAASTVNSTTSHSVNIAPGAVVIQSANPEAFRASSGQMAAELARMVSRGQRNL